MTCSPVMYWVRSTMCAPMSPSAPEPGLVLVAAARRAAPRGSAIQSCRYCARTCRTVADPAVGDQLAGQRDRRHPAVGEADHRADAVLGGPLGGGGHRLGLGDRVGQRLLAQHVLAGRQRGDRDLGVGVARRADVDEVDVVAALDEAAPVGLGLASSRAARPPRRPRRRRGRRRPSCRGAAGGRRSAVRCARPGSGRRP